MKAGCFFNSVNAPTVENQILSHVEKGSKLYTDDFLGYAKIGKFFEHKAVSHGKGDYVRGVVHSNSAESFWALFKRGYYGTYHTMSKKHLQRYVDEFTYRFNRRIIGAQDALFADIVNKMFDSDTLRYKKLIA